MACQMCRDCCNEVTLIVDKNRTDIPWLLLHGFDITDDGKDIRVKFKVECSKQINNKCSIYESRPEICKNFVCVNNIMDDFPGMKE